jgi:hypothetical protein
MNKLMTTIALMGCAYAETIPDIRMPLLMCINEQYAKAEDYMNRFCPKDDMIMHLLQAYIQEKMHNSIEADKHIMEAWKIQYDLHTMRKP